MELDEFKLIVESFYKNTKQNLQYQVGKDDVIKNLFVFPSYIGDKLGKPKLRFYALIPIDCKNSTMLFDKTRASQLFERFLRNLNTNSVYTINKNVCNLTKYFSSNYITMNDEQYISSGGVLKDEEDNQNEDLEFEDYELLAAGGSGSGENKNTLNVYVHTSIAKLKY